TFVLALSKLEERTAHVESAQSTPVVYQQRSTVEETLDPLLRIGLRAVREIGNRRDRAVGKADRQRRDVVDELSAACSRWCRLHPGDRLPDERAREIDKVTRLADDSTAARFGILCPVIAWNRTRVYDDVQRGRTATRG